MPRFFITYVLLLLAVACGAVAQTTAPTPEVLAQDLLEETVRINVTVKDLYDRQETVPIPVAIYRPAGKGPFPLVVFNHGRAVSAKRAAQGRSRPENLARYLVAKGFVVMAPTRVGYAETYGSFDPEDSGACGSIRVEPMSIAASDQVLATVEFAKTLPYVDASRWIVAGQSVGGLTAVTTVGRNPAGLLGGINFAGGTGGNPDTNPGRPCRPSAIEGYWGALAGAAKAPMLWLYWSNDKYWGEELPRQWHAAWSQGGAKAQLVQFPPSGEDGHNGLNADMDHWLPVVDAFLTQLGFAKPAIVTKPPASGYAALSNASAVPISAQNQAHAYAAFLALKLPRAFAVGDRGGWDYSSGDYAVGRAVGKCARHGQVCKLYAVDDDVVWVKPKP